MPEEGTLDSDYGSGGLLWTALVHSDSSKAVCSCVQNCAQSYVHSAWFRCHPG